MKEPEWRMVKRFPAFRQHLSWDHVWRLEDNVQETAPSFHHVSRRDRNQALWKVSLLVDLSLRATLFLFGKKIK